MKKYKTISAIAVIVFILASCAKDSPFDKTIMNIKGVVNDSQTKVSDSGFENSDQIGVFVIDYSGTTPGSLSPTTNHATNVKHTYVSAINSWTPETGKEIYWNDAVTPVDVYGYFPYNSSVTSISEYPFSVQTDQSTSSNYFNSDFIWAKTSNVTAQTLPVTLTFEHRMSKIIITTTAGDGFTESEFNAATKSVQILGTKLSSKINLSNGAVSVDNSAVNGTIIPKANGNVFTAVLVPQTIVESTVLFKVTVNGVEHYYSKGFTFESNKQYNFTISVNKNPLDTINRKIAFNTYNPVGKDPCLASYNFYTPQWHYFAVTISSACLVKIYVDGNLIDSGYLYNANGTVSTLSYHQANWYKLYIGASYVTGFDDFYKGFFDELKISNCERTSEYISTTYSNKNEFSIDNFTIGLWHFESTITNEVTKTVGSKSGDVDYNQGQWGKGLDFGGVNGSVDCNFSAIPETNVTFEFWAKFNESFGTKNINRCTVIQPYGYLSGNIFIYK